LHLGRRSRRPGGDRGGKSVISNFESSNFHKSKSPVQARNSIKIHNTKDKDLRIFKNSGGTVLPLIAGGDRGGIMECELTVSYPPLFPLSKKGDD
jgi:hypothetical protein